MANKAQMVGEARKEGYAASDHASKAWHTPNGVPV
jgi:hypothetical protein